MAGIAAWEASVALVVEGVEVVEGCSTSVNRQDSKPLGNLAGKVVVAEWGEEQVVPLEEEAP